MVNYFRCNEQHEQSQALAKDQQFKEAETANKRGGRAGSIDWASSGSLDRASSGSVDWASSGRASGGR